MKRIALPPPVSPALQQAARDALEEELEDGAIAVGFIVEDRAGRYRFRSVPDVGSQKLGLLLLCERELKKTKLSWDSEND